MAFTVDYRLKDMFFDRPEVIRRLAAAERKSLSRSGAFVRRRMRSLLRRRKRVSVAGEPPSVHSKDNVANLKNILFAFDGKDAVVIGPVGLNQVNMVEGSSMPVPELMERGGIVRIREVSNDGGQTWRRRDLRRNAREGQKFRIRSAIYKPRPYASRALEEERKAGTLDKVWAGSVR